MVEHQGSLRISFNNYSFLSGSGDLLDDDEYLLHEDEDIVEDSDKADVEGDFVDLDIDDL